ncbi:MAG: ATP-dependent Lon protease [Paraglaciecola sp.]|jgi:ATP-dependent Lon protease
MLPKRNNKVIEDIPAQTRACLALVFIEQVEEAVACAIASTQNGNDFEI